MQPGRPSERHAWGPLLSLQYWWRDELALCICLLYLLPVLFPFCWVWWSPFSKASSSEVLLDRFCTIGSVSGCKPSDCPNGESDQVPSLNVQIIYMKPESSTSNFQVGDRHQSRRTFHFSYSLTVKLQPVDVHHIMNPHILSALRTSKGPALFTTLQRPNETVPKITDVSSVRAFGWEQQAI